MTVDVHAARDQLLQPVGQPVAQASEPSRLARGQALAGQVCCLAEGDRDGDALGPCAQAAFLTTAADKGMQGDAVSDVESGDALGRAHLVPDDGEQVDAEVVDVDRDLADRLRGVAVQQDAVAAGDRGDVRNALKGARLVVGVHH